MDALTEALLEQHKDWHDQLVIIKAELEKRLKDKESKICTTLGILNYQLKNADGNPIIKIEAGLIKNLIKQLSETADPLPRLDVDYHKTHTDGKS